MDFKQNIFGCAVFPLSNGPDKKESNNGIEHVGMQKGANFTIVFHYTSDWLKQQKLRKLHKAVFISILNFPTNFQYNTKPLFKHDKYLSLISSQSE